MFHHLHLLSFVAFSRLGDAERDSGALREVLSDFVFTGHKN